MAGRRCSAGKRKRIRALYEWTGALGIGFLVVLGTHSPKFALAALVLSAMQIVFGREAFSWKLIFFLFSFANIFKLSPASTSLFTCLVLLFDGVLFIKRRVVSRSWVLFALYTAELPVLTLHFSNFDLLRWVKLLCSLLMLFYFFDRNTQKEAEGLFRFFIIGVLLSSLTYFLDPDFFHVSEYLEDEVGVYFNGMGEEEKELLRFAGLYSDPNYYAVNVIIAMCLCVILMHRGKLSLPVFALLTGVLFRFAQLTYSKSALIMTLLPIALFLYSNKLKKRRLLQAVSVVAGTAALVYLLLTGGGKTFGVVFNRFSSAEGDINRLTTGRFDIWRNNLGYLLMHPGTFLFGKGINAPLLGGRAHHNVYLEIIWHLGLVGGGILLRLLRKILRRVPRQPGRNLLNYGLLCCIMVMYFFLSMLFYFDTPYHLMLAFACMRMDLGTRNKRRYRGCLQRRSCGHTSVSGGP